jgi:hypothetical protein
VADVHPADCGNGTVDFDDLVFVITRWGSCSSFGPGNPIDEEAAIDILLAFMVEHEEHATLVLESIEYITENGL